MPKLIKFFFSKLGNIFEVLSPKGPSLLEVAHKNKIELEGACEGSLACSTCHVILDKDLFKKLGEPTDREYDLIDQAFQPKSTSRLGCQIKVNDLLKGRIIETPSASRNMAVDGYVPKPH